MLFFSKEPIEPKSHILVLLLLSTFIWATPFSANTNREKTNSSNQLQTGWVNANGQHYYYKNGKCIRNKVIKIGKYCYGFDKDGVNLRNKWGEFKKSPYKKNRYFFNAKGRLKIMDETDLYTYEISRWSFSSGKKKFVYTYMDSTVEWISISPNGSGTVSVSAKGTGSKYWVGLNGTKILCKNGSTIPYRKIIKGMRLRIFWKGDVFDSYPAWIPVAYKVKVL